MQKRKEHRYSAFLEKAFRSLHETPGVQIFEKHDIEWSEASQENVEPPQNWTERSIITSNISLQTI